MFSKERIAEKLIPLEKIEIGIKQSDNDEIISKAELEAEVEKWFQSTDFFRLRKYLLVLKNKH